MNTILFSDPSASNISALAQNIRGSVIGQSRRLLLLVALTMIIAVMMNGCAASSIQNIAIDIPRASDAALYLLPFEPPAKQLVVKDRRAFGYGILSDLDLLLIQIIKESNPSIYNYTINERDLANLRQSLLQSLEGAKAFDTVQVFSTVTDARPTNGLFLIIRLEEVGIVQKLDYYAVIKGSSRLEDKNCSVLGKIELDVNEWGPLSVGQCKNKAFKKVVEQTARMINKVVAQQNTESN
jgi:hypothetical protein